MKISVIIPIYNAALFLSQCLDSVLHQTYKDLEILCVDDGSTDHSRELLSQYEASDHRIKLFFQENLGASMARNLALRHAAGDYLMFVDSDDWLEPDTCQISI